MQYGEKKLLYSYNKNPIFSIDHRVLTEYPELTDMCQDVYV